MVIDTEAVRTLSVQLRCEPFPVTGPGPLLGKIFDDHDVTLDVVDAILSWIDDGVDIDLAQDLGALLHDCGSAWTAVCSHDGWQLERRIASELAELANTAVKLSGDEHNRLGQAWSAAFGRNPDPGKAYDKAIDAVEHVLCPIFLPNDPQPTLGKVIGRMRQKHDWGVPFRQNPAKEPKLTPHEAVVASCELLLNSQPRHGADGRGVAAPPEAEAAVKLAVLIVSWFADGNLEGPT